MQCSAMKIGISGMRVFLAVLLNIGLGSGVRAVDMVLCSSSVSERMALIQTMMEIRLKAHVMDVGSIVFSVCDAVGVFVDLLVVEVQVGARSAVISDVLHRYAVVDLIVPVKRSQDVSPSKSDIDDVALGHEFILFIIAHEIVAFEAEDITSGIEVCRELVCLAELMRDLRVQIGKCIARTDLVR